MQNAGSMRTASLGLVIFCILTPGPALASKILANFSSGQYAQVAEAGIGSHRQLPQADGKAQGVPAAHQEKQADAKFVPAAHAEVLKITSQRSGIALIAQRRALLQSGEYTAVKSGYEYSAFIRMTGDTDYCSGSLIAPTKVLTTAFCCSEAATSCSGGHEILIGAYRLEGGVRGDISKELGGTYRTAASFISNPKYGNRSEANRDAYNICIITLDKAVNITAIDFVPVNQTLATGSDITHVTWGVSTPSAAPVQELSLYSTKTTKCSNSSGYFPSNNSRYICYDKPDYGTCPQGSGGAIVSANDGWLVGFNSDHRQRKSPLSRNCSVDPASIAVNFAAPEIRAFINVALQSNSTQEGQPSCKGSPAPAPQRGGPRGAPRPAKGPSAFAPAPSPQPRGRKIPAPAPQRGGPRGAPRPAKGPTAYAPESSSQPGQAALRPAVVSVLQDSFRSFTYIDPSTGLAKEATPELISQGGEAFAQSGEISLVVRTSSPSAALPAGAVIVQGGTVTSTTPIEGGNGDTFKVTLATAEGAGVLRVTTQPGVSLPVGLGGSSVNSLNIRFDDSGPKTTITAGRYRSGEDHTFTVDFGKQVQQDDPRKLFNVTGTSRIDVVYEYAKGCLFVKAYVQQNLTADIVVTVAAAVTTDLAGNPNTAASYTYAYRPKSSSINTVSTVANAAAGTVLGVAVVGPIAASSLTSGTAGVSTAAASTFMVLHTLRILQITYLSAQMNVANLPVNFRQVAESFSWSVLDFRAPWEEKTDQVNSQSGLSQAFPSTPFRISLDNGSSAIIVPESGQTLRRTLLGLSPALAPATANNVTITLPKVSGGSSQYIVTSTGLKHENSTVLPNAISQLATQISKAALGDRDNPYTTIWRSFFWLGVALVATVVLGFLLTYIFALMRWTMPIILTFPRLQLVTLMAAVPAIANSSAGLFAQRDTKAILVGVVVVCLLPLMIILYAGWFVWRHILLPHRRRAAWILDDPKMTLQGYPSPWRRLLDVLVGPPGTPGTWVPLKHRDSRFVDHYGPFFEANQGPPMQLTGVTYETDPLTGFCDRGAIETINEIPILKHGRLVIYAHHLQALSSGLELLMGVATPILIHSFSEPDSYAQVILLIVLYALMLLWLRVVRPSGNRLELIVAMVACLSTMGIFVCGLVLLATPAASEAKRERIGIAMLVFGLGSLMASALVALNFFIRSFPSWRCAYHWAIPSRDRAKRFADVVYAVMEKEKPILARKFADRWLSKALGSGLHGRTLHRWEHKKRSGGRKASQKPPRVGLATATSGMLQSASSTASGASSLGAAGNSKVSGVISQNLLPPSTNISHLPTPANGRPSHGTSSVFNAQGQHKPTP